jgi:glutamine amidotransferase
MPIIKKNIAILDYGFGNIFKIKQAVEYNGFICTLITDLKDIDEYDALILPGVGSFPEGMKRLNKIKAKEKILEFVKKKKLLGICLGMQLLLEEGEEIKLTKGLGLIPGKVVRFPKNIRAHVGWSKVSIDKKIKHPIQNKNNNFFYFTHQFIVKTKEKFEYGTTNFSSIKFSTIIRKNNVYGVQFHPENSDKNGAKLIGQILNDH